MDTEDSDDNLSVSSDVSWETQRGSPSRSEPHSALFRAVVKKRWDAALKILKNPSRAPLEARFINRIDEDTATTLHIACNYDDTPLEVVTRLLQENPEAALFQTGKDSYTPLYLATIWSSVAVCRKQIEACPAAASIQNPNGQTPLHLACQSYKLSPEKVRLLLQADPSQLETRDYQGLTPLDAFFSKYNRCMRETYQEIVDRGFESDILYPLLLQNAFSSFSNQRETSWRNILCSANDLLYTHLHGKWSQEGVRDRCQWNVLHACLRVRSCPWVYYKFALAAFPEQAFERDLDGNLPLHIAAAVSSICDSELYECYHCRTSPIHGPRYHHKQYMDVYCSGCCSHFDRDKEEYYTSIPVDKCSAAISDLLAVYPEAAVVPNGEGRLPLHLAIAARKTWYNGIQQLAQGTPHLLLKQDTNTRLHPFLLAATVSKGHVRDKDEKRKNFAAPNQGHLGEIETKIVHVSEDEIYRAGLGTVFQLLVENPNVLSLLH